MIKLKRMEALSHHAPEILFGIVLTTGVANRNILLCAEHHTGQSWEEAVIYDNEHNYGWQIDYTGPRRFSLKKQWS